MNFRNNPILDEEWVGWIEINIVASPYLSKDFLS